MPRSGTPVHLDPISAVASCVAEVLGIDAGPDGGPDVGPAVDPDVRLTELGLESFTAVRLRRRLRERTGADLPIADFLGEATARSLAARLPDPLAGDPATRPAPSTGSAEAVRPARPAETPAHPVPPPDAFPLTPVQSAYWVGRDPSFPLGGVATFYFHEFDRVLPDGDHDGDLTRLEDAWNILVRHHPMLRAIVDDDGMQRVLADPGPYRIGRTDLRAVSADERAAALARLRAERSHQTRRTDTWPLYDIHAALLPDGGTRLYVGMDVLALDMTSWLLLMRQWGALVADPTALPAPCTTDFGTVLRERAADPQELQRRERAGAYWARRAAELPPGPALPWTAAANEPGPPRFTRHQDGLTAAEWTRLRSRAAEHGLSPTGVLLAAFALTLNRRGAGAPFCLNTTLFDRPDDPQLLDIVGDFTTTVLVEPPLPDLSRPWTFAAWAGEVNRRFWSDLEHRAVSGVEVLRRAGRVGGTPAHPVVFTSGIGLADGDRPVTAWLGEEVYAISQTPQILLDHIVRDDGGALRIVWDSVDGALPADWIRDCLAAEIRLLRRLTEPHAWTSPTLAADPAFLPDEPPAPNPFPTAGPLLDDPWAAAARRTPDAPALLGIGRRLDHGELAHRVRSFAATLAASGVAAGTPVAIALDEGHDRITAVLAVGALGAWYVPVEPTWPAARVASVCARTGLTHAVAEPDAAPAWPAGIVIVAPDRAPGPKPAEPGGPAELPEPAGGRPEPDDLAYAVFTSGSTGTPKGVAIEHAAARTTVDDIVERFDIGPGDRVLGLSALSFDLSVFDVFGLLGAGGALVLPDPDRSRDPEHWLDLADTHAVTVWNTAPALLEMLVEYGELEPERTGRQLRSLRLVMLSGDWIPITLPDRLRALAPQARFVSLGGATEASIWSVIHPVERVDPSWTSIPYGRALRGQSFRILDENGTPVPLGQAGELHIGGAGLARCYVADPEQTDGRFAFHPQLGERLYRTGDLGRWRQDGTIEFLGRVDRQVKIRGHRIELGEIEAVLGREPGVRQCVASAVRTADRRLRLIAHVVPEHGRRPDADTERRWTRALRERLPAYMIPTRYVVLDRLPVTANGKIDHAALAEPGPNPADVVASPHAPEPPEPDARLDPTAWLREAVAHAHRLGLEPILTVRQADGARLDPLDALHAAADWAHACRRQAHEHDPTPTLETAGAGALAAFRIPADPTPRGTDDTAAGGSGPRIGTLAPIADTFAPTAGTVASATGTFESTAGTPASNTRSARIDPATLDTVVGVFTELLDRPVEPHTSFFVLGASSLDLVRAHRRLRGLGVGDLAVVDLFEHPTAHALATRIVRGAAESRTPTIASTTTGTRANTAADVAANAAMNTGASTAARTAVNAATNAAAPGRQSRLTARARAQEISR
ncbi:amino acid adenylation domain-containing protein [Embleya sp. NPDC050493]|uniref:amino acid adenylation domain-containing protein n=1 Tax=Embleya sp. NPDC050493 TaxID=3363989 RepID=UPI00379CC2E3